MKKEWKSLRVTIALYAALLLLPVGTYYGYKAYRDLQETEVALNLLSKAPEGLLMLTSGEGTVTQRSRTALIEKGLEQVATWVHAHQNDKDYVGGGSLSDQYEGFRKCWDEIYQSQKPKGSVNQCLSKADALVFSLERMHLLKKNRFENIFVVSLAVVLLLLLLIIYFVRFYVALQHKRAAIRDIQTPLYSRKFIEESFKKLCAASQRYKDPFSVMHITVTELNPKSSSMDDAERTALMNRFAKVIWEVVRESDVAAHVGDDVFVLLLPRISAKEAEVAASRIRKKMPKSMHMEIKTVQVGENDDCGSIYTDLF